MVSLKHIAQPIEVHTHKHIHQAQSFCAVESKQWLCRSQKVSDPAPQGKLRQTCKCVWTYSWLPTFLCPSTFSWSLPQVCKSILWRPSQTNTLEAFKTFCPLRASNKPSLKEENSLKKKKNKHGLKPLKLLQLKTLERSTGKKNKKIQRCNRLNGLNYKHAMVRDREGETQW